MILKSFQSQLISCLILAVFSINANADHRTIIEINEDAEIDILHIGNAAPISIIWFACNQGEETVVFKTARKLSTQGYQFYFPDMLSAHFLSPTASNIAKIPTAEVAMVIQHILSESKSNQVYLVGGARAAIPILRGLSDPAIKKISKNLKGALLITPRITIKSPEPGTEPVYIKEAGLSNHPLRVLEGELTPNRWGLLHLVSTLTKSGSRVEADIIKGARGFFYLRNNQSPEEEKITQHFDKFIHKNIQELSIMQP